MKKSEDISVARETQRPLSGVWRQLGDISWPLRILLVLSVLLPLGFASWYAWHKHSAVLNETQAAAQRSVVALVEHADSILEAHSLVLRQIENMSAGKSWSEIAADQRLHVNVTDLVRNFSQIAIIGMADRNGRVRISSAGPVSEETSIADRDYFTAQRDSRIQGMFFSQAFTSRLTGKRQFTISIARRSASGEFDGIIFTAVSIDYLVSFWKQFVPSSGYLIPMIRDDGMLMVRYPVSDNPERLDPNGPFVTHVRRAPRGIYTAVSQVDGIERINAYSRITNYPLYISYSVEKNLAMQPWRKDALMAAGVAVLVSGALLTLLMFAIQQSLAQRRTAARWRALADDLGCEVARRKEAEAALLHAQKIEALGNLTGGIAHDFNNLLAGISGNLELMRIRLASGHDDVAKHIDAAEAVVDKAAAITKRLLAFSRRQALSPKPTNVNERVGFMHELIARTIGPSIHLHTELAPDIGITLCDPNLLDSALLNLAINARDAMPLGGEVVVTTANVTIDSEEDANAAGIPRGEYVRITIADTGCGMPAEVLERVFDPFYTTKPIGQGTGLGLSMVHGFIKQSGGEIRIESTVNAGTTVRLYLPLLRELAGRAQPTSMPVAARLLAAKAKVLLVDDETALRNVLAETLADIGCQVMPAEDGAAALNIIAAAAPIDLLITDIGLPGAMNGRALAAEVKAHQPDVKVIFITGYHDPAITEADLRAQGAVVMNKPFKLDDFMRTVSNLTE